MTELAPHILASGAPSKVRPLVELDTLTRCLADGWRFSLPHARTEHLLIWTTRGQGRVIINGVRRGVGANNVFWLPSGTQFALELGPNVQGHVLSFSGHDPSLLPLNPHHLRIRDVALQSELGNLIDLIQREAQRKAPLQDEALLAKFILVEVWMRRALLIMLDANDAVQDAFPEMPRASHRLVTAFAKQAEAGYATGRAMADFAADLDVTPTHLTRVCREITGLTAADLLTGRVLHEARRLLCDTSLPAQNIAQHLGFGSAAYFSRFILKHTGASPSALRRA